MGLFEENTSLFDMVSVFLQSTRFSKLMGNYWMGSSPGYMLPALGLIDPKDKCMRYVPIPLTSQSKPVVYAFSVGSSATDSVGARRCIGSPSLATDHRRSCGPFSHSGYQNIPTEIWLGLLDSR